MVGLSLQMWTLSAIQLHTLTGAESAQAGREALPDLVIPMLCWCQAQLCSALSGRAAFAKLCQPGLGQTVSQTRPEMATPDDGPMPQRPHLQAQAQPPWGWAAGLPASSRGTPAALPRAGRAASQPATPAHPQACRVQTRIKTPMALAAACLRCTCVLRKISKAPFLGRQQMLNHESVELHVRPSAASLASLSDAYLLLTGSKANSSRSQLMAQSPFASPGSFSAQPPSLCALHARPQCRCCFCVVSGLEACPKKLHTISGLACRATDPPCPSLALASLKPSLPCCPPMA